MTGAPHAKFPVRPDDVEDEASPESPTRRSRVAKYPAEWIIAAAHGVLGCKRCGDTYPLVPTKDTPAEDHMRELRAFLQKHACCHPRTT